MENLYMNVIRLEQMKGENVSETVIRAKGRQLVEELDVRALYAKTKEVIRHDNNERED